MGSRSAAPSAANHAGNLTLLGVLNATPELNFILSFSWLWRMANPENAPDGGWRLDGDQVISGPEPYVAPGAIESGAPVHRVRRVGRIQHHGGG